MTRCWRREDARSGHQSHDVRRARWARLTLRAIATGSGVGEEGSKDEGRGRGGNDGDVKPSVTSCEVGVL